MANTEPPDAAPRPLQPPERFRELPIEIVVISCSLFRTHPIGRNALFFGRTGRNRFDAPDGSYGVMYSAEDPFGAFIETFGHQTGTFAVTTDDLRSRVLAEFRAPQSYRIADLTQSGALVRIGTDARLFAGEHGTAQLWSLAIYGHPSRVDGIAYPGRLDPTRRNYALFDRAPRPSLLSQVPWYPEPARAGEQNDAGRQRALLADVLAKYNYSLIETQFKLQRKPALDSMAAQSSLF